MDSFDLETYFFKDLPFDKLAGAPSSDLRWKVTAPEVDGETLDYKLHDETTWASPWRRFETASDRPLFGIWAQPETRLILRFQDREIIVIGFGRSEDYDLALIDLCEEHDQIPVLAIYQVAQDDEPELYPSRRALFLNPALFDEFTAKLRRRLEA